jgi:glucose/arabinose dehydrogenase
MSPRVCLLAVGFVFCLGSAGAPAFARPFRVNQIPNGSIRACLNCHVSPESGGPRNLFGQQVESGFLDPPGQTGNVVWGPPLAGLDADGDGITNGSELQDPAGAWSVGQPQPGDPALVTNPGIAESDITNFAPIAQFSGVPVRLRLVVDGLNAPLEAKVAPGEPGRLYVLSQGGAVTAVDRRTGTKTPFVDVNNRLVPVGILGPGSFDERGLLGIAFHPRYRRNGRFFLYTSEPNGGPPTFPTTLPAGSEANHQNVVSEWRANSPGNPAAGATFVKELMRIDWPQFNHNAGDLEFGPDGKLYIATGDGGGSDDEDGDQSINPPPGVIGHPNGGNAQNLSVVLGKILRVDVDGQPANGRYNIPQDNPFVQVPGAAGEVWAFGLRNPFRMSFDSATGRLFAGDVGQNDIEEVDHIVKGGNYGWNKKEGTLCFVLNSILPGFATPTCPPNLPPGLIDPIAQFDTRTEGFSVIGGFVYRGKRFKELRGKYVFGDYSRIFSFPNGPDNYGRLLYLEETNLEVPGLKTIKEFKNVAEEAARLNLTDPTRPPAPFAQTLSLMGWGEDNRGNIFALGSRSGRVFDLEGNRRTDGFIVLLLAPRCDEGEGKDKAKGKDVDKGRGGGDECED